MAQNKAGLEKVMQSALKHRRAGTEMSTAILGIEAMTASGIDTAAIVENTDKKVLGRCRAALCHKEFGKRMADAVTTLEQIIADEGLTIVAADKVLTGAPHKGKLRKVVIDEITRRTIGTDVANIADKAEQAVDQLLVIYGAGGAKEDAPTEANLVLIKAILAL